MFPVNSSGALIPAILWQGIPIHTVPLKMDQVLAMKAPCPNFDVEMKNLLNTDYFKEILEKFEPTFRFVFLFCLKLRILLKIYMKTLLISVSRYIGFSKNRIYYLVLNIFF